MSAELQSDASLISRLLSSVRRLGSAEKASEKTTALAEWRTLLSNETTQTRSQSRVSQQNSASTSFKSSKSYSSTLSEADSQASSATNEIKRNTKRIFEKFTTLIIGEKELVLAKQKKGTKDSGSAEMKMFEFGKDMVSLCQLLASIDGAMDDSFKLLLDHAVEGLWASGNEVIRIIVAQKSYRDRIPRSQLKSLMDLTFSNLFSDASGSKLSSAERLELSKILFYLCIISQKDSSSKCLVIFGEVCKFLSQRHQEYYCHPAMLAVISHLILEEYANHALELTALLEEFIPSLIKIWEICQYRSTFYQPGFYRPAVLQLLRLYSTLANLNNLKSVDETLNKSDSERYFEENISLIYQASWKELKRSNANIIPLSNPSLFISALSISFNKLTPFLSLNHATDFAVINDGDMNDGDITTWGFLDLFSDSVLQLVKSADDRLKSINEEAASRKRRKFSHSSVINRDDFGPESAISEILQSLQNPSPNHRNFLLQLLSLVFRKLAAMSQLASEYTLRTNIAHSIIDAAMNILISDPNNTWASICLGFMSLSCRDYNWSKIYSIVCSQNDALSEHTMFLLLNICVILEQEPDFVMASNIFSANDSVCRYILENRDLLSLKSKKDLHDIASAIFSHILKNTTQINPMLAAEAILTLCGGKMIHDSKCNFRNREFGLWPNRTFPTEIAIEEWRFGEVKKIACLLQLESYELIFDGKSNHINVSETHSKSNVDYEWIFRKISDSFSESTSTLALLKLLVVSKIIIASIATLVPSCLSVAENIVGPQINEALEVISHNLTTFISQEIQDSAISLKFMLMLFESSNADFLFLSLPVLNNIKIVLIEYFQVVEVGNRIESNLLAFEKPKIDQTLSFSGHLIYFSHHDLLENSLEESIQLSKKLLHRRLVVETLGNLYSLLIKSEVHYKIDFQEIANFILANMENIHSIPLIEISSSQDFMFYLLNGFEMLLGNSFSNEKNPWTWLSIIRVMQMAVFPTFDQSNSVQTELFVQIVSFLANEVQKGLVPKQLTVEFGFADLLSNVVHTLVPLILTLENSFDSRKLFYLAISRVTKKGLQFLSDKSTIKSLKTSSSDEKIVAFILNACRILAPSIAENSKNFRDSIQLIEALPLTKAGVTTGNFVSKFSGLLAANFIGRRNFESFNELCQYLEIPNGDLIKQNFDALLIKIFSLKDAQDLADWFVKEAGGQRVFYDLILKHIPSIVFELSINFNCLLPHSTDFANDPETKQIYLEIFGFEKGQKNSVASSGISCLKVMDVFHTIKQLFGKDTLSSLISDWDFFNLLKRINDDLEETFIISEKIRITQNGIPLLLIIGSKHLESPFLLQISFSMVLKFISDNGKLYLNLIRMMLKCSKLSNRSQAISVAKLFHSTAIKAKELNVARSEENYFISSLKLLLDSLDRFKDIQRLCLVYIDPRNSLFKTILEAYSKEYADGNKFSKLIEEAISLAIPETESAIVRFLHHSLELSKEMVFSQKIIAFLNQALSSTTNVKIEAIQCLAILTTKIDSSISFHINKNPQQIIISLLTSCVESLDPIIMDSSISAAIQILQMKDDHLWNSAISHETSNVFEFFKRNLIFISETRRNQKAYENLDVNLWSHFDICKICDNLVSSFETCEMFTALRSIFQVEQNIAIATFPLLIHDILAQENQSKSLKIEVRGKISKCFTIYLDSIEMQSTASIQSVLSVLEYLWMQPNPGFLQDDFWVDVNFLAASKAALKIKNRKLALLFFELSLSKSGSNMNYDILLKIYKLLDQDAFDGVLNSVELTDANMLAKYNQHKEFSKVLCSYNAKMMATSMLMNNENTKIKPSSDVKFGFSESLAKLGCYSGVLLSNEYLDVDDLHCESLWRCGAWNESQTKKTISEHNYFVFNAGKSLNMQDSYSAKTHVYDGFSKLSLKLDLLDGGSSMNIQSRLMPAIQLYEIQDAVFLQKSINENHFKLVFSEWNNRLLVLIQKIDFDSLEPVIFSRISVLVTLFKSNLKLSLRSFVYNQLVTSIILYSKQGRKSGNFQFSTIGTAMLKALNAIGSTESTNLNFDIASDSEFEESKVLFAQGNESIAIKKLKEIIRNCSNPKNSFHLAKLHSKLAKWSDIQRSENPQTILKYFERATQFISTSELPQHMLLKSCSYFYNFAAFADKTYSAMSSDETHESLKLLVEERQAELDLLKANLKLKPDDSITKSAVRRLNNQIRFDRLEIHRYSKEIERFLFQSRMEETLN
ncbi:hypothetical protein HK100_000617 [Physocladia obscura]|uniref:Uncharacterized protein n=1 Tax=Physocladia obscura TaxID=109957 RepID=A0AAD5SY40_9FUNG|nr:hypothetical protein HK100_000617 [Physocladia obscura]